MHARADELHCWVANLECTVFSCADSSKNSLAVVFLFCLTTLTITKEPIAGKLSKTFTPPALKPRLRSSMKFFVTRHLYICPYTPPPIFSPYGVGSNPTPGLSILILAVSCTSGMVSTRNGVFLVMIRLGMRWDSGIPGPGESAYLGDDII